jgi:hypothetical protein
MLFKPLTFYGAVGEFIAEEGYLALPFCIFGLSDTFTFVATSRG